MNVPYRVFNVPLLDSNHQQSNKKYENEEINQETRSEKKIQILVSILVLTVMKFESLLYNTEIPSIEIKICSKTTLRSIKNQNLQQNYKKKG